ncbi:MAG: M15 family metallopeptidase [Elusimicrobia bacterium]|nr:M15 family metallopeptidase [Elusimicrobiota bacterium]
MKNIIIYVIMKKYIFSLAAFIVLYIGAMYFVQENTSIKPAGQPKAGMSDFFAELKQPSSTAVAQAETQHIMTPQEEEALKLKAERERLAREQAQAEAARLKAETEKRDALFASKGLVNAESLPVKLFLDIRYATENNFAGQKMYTSDKCYLQQDAAEALAKAAQYAAQEDSPFYLCLYDCYRPLSAQKTMWDIHPVPGQVANPKTGSNHNRGTAIDLGPCDANGYPLEVPTQFDDFSEQAYAYAREGVSPAAQNNRAALQKVMRKAGFTTIRKEWWHFNYKNANKYPIVDLEF